jgi:Tfp pilus assembly protein PilX
MHNQGTMPHKGSSGQILVLVLLVVLIGMSIGLSIASRTLSNLRDTTNLNLSNRAFNAAEAGIEHALTKLNNDPHACDNDACTADMTGSGITGVDSFKITTSTIGENSNAFSIESVNRDDVVQVNLEGYAGSTIKVYWGTTADHGNCGGTGANTTAAIVVNVVYKLSGTYGMSKAALDDCATAHNNNFNSTDVTDTPSPATITAQDGSSHTGYGYMSSINVKNDGSGLVPSGATVLLARIRLMYGDSTEQVAIAPVGANLPNQGQQITSTAVAGQTQRTVKVVRSNTNLPAIFDYALFNGSTQALSK